MTTNKFIAWEEKYIVPTYVRPPVVFTHGQGAYLFDDQGQRYLDFAAGIAVNALGHADEQWLAALTEQAGRLTHVSNLYYTVPQIELARRLVKNSFADRVFFCNSGSEANESALKFARKYARSHHKSGDNFTKTGIVAFSASFHGRSMGALSTTYKSKYREPFAPLVPGVTFADFNDLASAAQAVNQDSCAVIVEPIQGEGGVNPADPAFLKGLRALCDENNALLIFDEVQCGLGRSGKLWAYETYGVTPDMMNLAKPLAGGLPIGATLVTEAIAQIMKPGDHGSTFGGGPLVCSAANVVFDRVNQPQFLAQVRESGAYLVDRLRDLDSPQIVSVRGAGLLIGLELRSPVAPLVTAAREQGLLVINAGENVLRLCPPLTVTPAEIDQAVDILERCLEVLE
jgi:predicted acetylornithine/succinylornithine family transaminase